LNSNEFLTFQPSTSQIVGKIFKFNKLATSYWSQVDSPIRIYDDRLEVWNPGRLLPDLSIKALYRQHASHPRNPRLAHAFYRARLIEHWGTGTLRIIEACRKHNLEAEFSVEAGFFVVTLKQPPGTRAVLRPDLRLNDRQKKALAYLKDHLRMTRQDYERVTQTSPATAKWDIEALTKLSLLLQRGKGPSAFYEMAPHEPI
jgi:ATP-dependent DNA helicase RecG